MPRLSKSEPVKRRVGHLLQRLLDYANQQLDDGDRFLDQLITRWIDETSKEPKLVVRTTLSSLAELAYSDSPSRLVKEHIRHDLQILREFIKILDDNRAKTQGASHWHFTLKLWHTSTERNMQAFNLVWDYRKAHKGTDLPPNLLDPYNTSSQLPEIALSELITPRPPIYHNLPNRYYSALIGSKALLTKLHKLLSAEHSDHLLSLVGTGGIGKTTLILEAAHRCLAASQNPDHYPGIPTFEAIIFASAKSKDWLGPNLSKRLRPERDLQDIFRVIFRTLRIESLPPTLEEQIDAVCDALSRQATLLIIDNLETLEDQNYILSFVRELPPTVKVVLTSRIRLGIGTMIPVSRLTLDEGMELIRHQAHTKAITLNQFQATAIYQKAGGLPLAIAFALGHMAVYGTPPDMIPAQFTHLTADLRLYCFEELVQPLRGQPPHQLLMAIALFPRPTSTTALAQVAFAQIDPAIAQASIDKLYQLSLIERHQEQCEIHSLTRQFSSAELSQHPTFEKQARDRWVTWFQHFLQPYTEKNWRDWQEYGALDQEWENVRAAIEWCKEQKRYDDFQQLWQPLKGYTQLRGHWQERLEWLEWLRRMAEQREDWATVADTLYNTSLTLFFFNQTEQTDTAIQLSQHAWSLAELQTDDFKIDLAIHLAALYLYLQQFEQAFHWFDQGQMLLDRKPANHRSASRQWVEMLYYKAEIHLRQNEYEPAQQLYSKALHHAEAIGWQRLIAYTKGWLAVIAIAQGQLDTAEQLLKPVFSAALQNNDKRCFATCQRHFAEIEKARGNLPNSRQWAQSAKDSYEQLNMHEQAAAMDVLLKHLEQ